MLKRVISGRVGELVRGSCLQSEVRRAEAHPTAGGWVRGAHLSCLLLALVLAGCGGDATDGGRADPAAPPPSPPAESSSLPAASPAATSEPTAAAQLDSESREPSGTDRPADAAAEPPPTAATPTRPPARPTLDEQLAALQIPPPWLEPVTTGYDTSKPWQEARLEIRRLLSLNQPAAHREALKLTWIYLQKNDMNDGHEYPMYTFLGGQPLWSIRAHEEYLQRPHPETPIHAYLSLASLYAQYGEFERAKACLDRAMAGLPEPPWQVMREADLLAAYGDLYVAWNRLDLAKENYAQAARLYPTAKPPYGGHLLPRRAADVQTRLDRLALQSLSTAALKDGRYQAKALGYVGDIHVTLTIRAGQMADIQLKHEEKIDQNACVIIPQRILQQQTLEVDGISGATVTQEAIVNGVFRCLQQAGLR